MSTTELELIYRSLVDSGDLVDMFPNMTGNWEKDKKKFSASYLDATYLGEGFDTYEEDIYDEF